MSINLLILTILNQAPRIFVEPAKIEKIYQKGKNYTEVFTVEVRDFPAHIEVYVEDFLIKEDGKFEFKKPGTYPFSLSPFVKISPRSFDLEGGEKKEVRVSFTLPDTMESFEKWCMIIFRAYPKKERIPTVQIVGEIGTPIYAILPFENTKDAQLLEMGKEKGEIYFTLENLSPVHLRTTGKVYLLNSSNEKIWEEEFSNLVVLPLKKRIYYFDIPKEIGKGNYKFFCEVDYGIGEVLKGEKEITLP